MRESINTITIENISHAYRDDESVLRNVNAIFEKGDSISIMGTSGVGKTTLLKIMSGLMKPSDGKVLFDHIDYYTLSEKNRFPFEETTSDLFFKALN